MILRDSAKLSEQKPWNNLNIKILTPGKRRGFVWWRGGLMVSFVSQSKSHSVIGSDKKV